jgi:2-(1,2-epoxy-1,2-dihydrophenyl)acetyl-CoA isomerase
MSEPLTHDDRVLRIRVSRGRHGTLDGEAMPVAAHALREVDPDRTGAVLLVGDEGVFCTGGDVRAFAGAQDRAEYVGALAGAFHEFLAAMVEAPVPVVAAVQGWAAGAGMSIVLAADLAVGGRSTKLRPAYPGIGFSPDGGMSWTLPRIVGAAKARHMLLTDRVVGADEALDLGILAAVVDDAEVLGEAEVTARKLAAGPTRALGRIKTLLAASPGRSLAEHLPAEAASIAACAAGPEGTEGLAAFGEKRAPKFW